MIELDRIVSPDELSITCSVREKKTLHDALLFVNSAVSYVKNLNPDFHIDDEQSSEQILLLIGDPRYTRPREHWQLGGTISPLNETDITEMDIIYIDSSKEII